MRIGYLIDLNTGGYDQPMPSPEDAHDTMEAMIEEGVVAERSGFHSIQVPTVTGAPSVTSRARSRSSRSSPARPTRSRSARSPGVATLFHPMKAPSSSR